MIEEILEAIPAEAVMYLINAIMFDAEWARIYERHEIRSGRFTTFDNREQTVSFMSSTERFFIEDNLATGFIKPYLGGHYSFVALLPNEGVCILEYVDSLTGTNFINTIQEAQTTSVIARLPKFEFDFELSLIESLQALGMIDAFCEFDADLTGLGHSSLGNLFISEVSHNTFVSVDERGTRAGAVTSVEASPSSAPNESIILDRPFVFAVIDTATSLPIFMGTVLEV